MSIPDAAIEAAAREWFAIDESRYSGDADWPTWESDENADARDSYQEDARAVIEAAMPAIREALAQEIERLPINRRCASVHEYVTQVVRGGAA